MERRVEDLPPSDAPLWELVTMSLHEVAVAVAVDTGLLDACDGSRTAREVASATATDPHVADTLVEHLAALGFVDVRADGRVCASPVVAAHLRRGEQDGFGALLDRARQRDPRYGRLLEAARVDSRPRAAVDHYAAIDGPAISGAYVSVAARALAGALDLSDVTHIVDVGGGHGRILAMLLERWPDVTATLIDLESVVAAAQAALARHGLGGRAAVVAADFGRGLPVPARAPDLFLLSQVLVDLGPQERAALLRRCREQLPPAGRIAVHEMLAPEAAVGPVFAAMNTELAFWSRGRHLTAAGLRDALLDGGFRDIVTRPTWGLWSVTTGRAG